MAKALSQGTCISKAVFMKFLYLLKNHKSLIVFRCIEAQHDNLILVLWSTLTDAMI